jgi:hypothetical protein
VHILRVTTHASIPTALSTGRIDFDDVQLESPDAMVRIVNQIPFHLCKTLLRSGSDRSRLMAL